MEAILQWVSRESKGKLIFDDRPYVYYLVRPSKEPTGETYVDHRICPGLSEYGFSGKITFSFTAYDPFGYLTYNSTTEANDPALERCGMIETDLMPSLTTALGNHLLYNPGTEPCPLRITIGGTAPSGVTIHNYTTGETCRLVSLPENDTLVIDGATGFISLGSNHATAAFSYHNDGYLHLDPCIPYRRNVAVSWTQNGNALTSAGLFKKTDAGSYIYFGSKWRKILSVTTDSAAVLSEPVDVATGSGSVMITKMNELYVEGTGATLTTFSAAYTARVR